MIDRSKFLEPTERYIKENSLITDTSSETCKDWYNVDLIFFAVQYKNSDYQKAVETQMVFDQFRKLYDLDLTMEEIDKRFGNYPKETFDELVKELVSKSMQKA